MKSKHVNDREIEKGRRGKKRKRSSMIKIFQDDAKIGIFKEFEENLLKGEDQGKFWKIFWYSVSQSSSCINLEQLVKRFNRTYIFGEKKKLNITHRVSLREEMTRVVEFINEKLNFEQEFEIRLSDFHKNRSTFHYCSFLLSLMNHIAFSENQSLKDKLGLTATLPPFEILDIEIFIGNIPWPSIKGNLKKYFSSFQKFIEKICSKNSEGISEFTSKPKDYRIRLGSTMTSSLLSTQLPTCTTSQIRAPTFHSILDNVPKKLKIKSKNEDEDEENKETLPFLSYDLIVSLLHLAMSFAGEPFIMRELIKVVAEADKELFNRRLDYIFPRRKKYLLVNLRYLEMVRNKSTETCFKKIYPSKEIWEGSRLKLELFKQNFFLKFSNNFKKVSLDLTLLNLKVLNKAMIDFGMNAELIQVGQKLAIFLLKEKHKLNGKLKYKEHDLSIGVIFFLLKLFYGVGVDTPSLITLKEETVEKFIVDKELKKKMLSCLAFIDSKAMNQKKEKKSDKKNLLYFSRNLPTYSSLMQRWCDLYEEHKRNQKTLDSFIEVKNISLANFQKVVKNFFEESTFQKCEVKPSNVNMDIELTKNEILQRMLTHGLKEIEVDRNLEDVMPYEEEELREELMEETEFILQNFGTSKSIEIPHPSDIFTKFKFFGSCPLEHIGVDYLALLEFGSFYFEIEKERLIQTAMKIERVIVKLFEKIEEKS
jgi:hypothetical protein